MHLWNYILKRIYQILLIIFAVFVGTVATAHEALRVGPTVVRAGGPAVERVMIVAPVIARRNDEATSNVTTEHYFFQSG